MTANTGAAGTSEWIHVNTQDALSTPVCVSPVGTIVEDTQGVTFVWRHEISTGTAQTAYELQTSSNMGGQYTTLSTAETDASSFATPAGQFAQGTLTVSYTHLYYDMAGRGVAESEITGVSVSRTFTGFRRFRCV